MAKRRVVDNRVFLLGLDEIYRCAMKRHERAELLSCAREVARTLQVAPANVPVEGYYAEEPELTEYFRLLRALQGVEESRIPEVAHLQEFQRLRAVTSSPLYGRSRQQGNLLPVGQDALSQALLDTRPKWELERLTMLASELAREMDDISLVGLAARVRDPVVLTAARESCVLYALNLALGIPPKQECVWQVDKEIADAANRFIDAFQSLFHVELPRPTEAQAERYWDAYEHSGVLGRCVRIGYEVAPVRHYHWGIYRNDNGELAVQEFWSSDLWTSDAYRGALGPDGRAPRFPEQASADESLN